MEAYETQAIGSIIILILFILLKYLILKLIDRVGLKYEYQKSRIKIINKVFSIILFSLMVMFLLLLWGINRSELTFFMSSIITVFGIAFLAQWSLISNITSAVIIFVNHPIKIGDTIIVYDKDFQLEGRISDIGMFFISIKTVENELITIPSNVFMQKMIKRRNPIE